MRTGYLSWHYPRAKGAGFQQGMSMLEVTVVLVVASLLSWAAFGAYGTFERDRERAMAQALAQQMQTGLRAFAMRHGRLPCPDTGGTGHEAGGGACTQLGGFPYVSVGLDLPPALQRARYAVFRLANATASQDADLAVAIERTGDAPGDIHHLDVTDLIAGLNNAAAQSASAAHPYLTGDDGPAGAIGCAVNRVMVVAYWMVLPLGDSDGDGQPLDAPHIDPAALCATSPSAPLRADSDDIVLAESPAQLAGWLRRTLP